MLRTRNIITDVTVVPSEWIFETYISSLPERLQGQDIKMKSIFKEEKTPSMCLYVDVVTMTYKFKDFASGHQGSPVDLVMLLFNLTYGQAAHKILIDYNDYLSKNKKPEVIDFTLQSRYEVTAHSTRGWNTDDKRYWTKFFIGSPLLEKFNVKPLTSYTLSKQENGELKEIVITGACIYGYFKKDGTLYKIYQPMLKENKFIKVAEYIQGSGQLTYQVPYLVICSSLKDVMAFTKLGFRNAEAIAPDSENVTITKERIDFLKSKYQNICTIFDNDEAGLKAMKKYEELYGIPYAHLQLEKDLSDSVRDHGVSNTRIVLYPTLTKALTGKAKQL
jgi:hypothetical protein